MADRIAGLGEGTPAESDLLTLFEYIDEQDNKIGDVCHEARHCYQGWPWATEERLRTLAKRCARCDAVAVTLEHCRYTKNKEFVAEQSRRVQVSDAGVVHEACRRRRTPWRTTSVARPLSGTKSKCSSASDTGSADRHPDSTGRCWAHCDGWCTTLSQSERAAVAAC